MFAAALNRFTMSLSLFTYRRVSRNAPKRAALPTWIDDPQLSEQLLNDTGLSPEDLGGRPVYDEKKPFFMQQNYW